MSLRARRFIVTMMTGGMLFAGLAAPASAAPALVDVHIEDNTITVPINAAANICGVDVDVLVLALQEEGDQTFTDCDARGNQDVTVTG